MTEPETSFHSACDALPEQLYREQISVEGQRVRQEWLVVSRKAAKRNDDGGVRLAAAMLALQSQRPSRPLLGRANARTLRWVDSRLRQTRAAAHLAAATPDLPIRTRISFGLSRLAAPAAAGFVILLCKARVFDLFEGTARLADRLAKLHIDRHIGPMV